MMRTQIPRVAAILRPSLRIPIAARQSRALPAAPQSFILPFTHQSRFYSQSAPPRKVYTFQDIKAHLSSPTPSRILIDAREPSELQETGTIPGSLNIPVKSRPDSWHISDEVFEDRFGFERPGKEEELVFYCKAGVRSRAAAELARLNGWGKVGEYEGSWLDWEENGGEKEKVK